MDITQQDFDYFIRAYEAFKKAGREGHFPCSSAHTTGTAYGKVGATRCIISRSRHDLPREAGLSVEKMIEVWRDVIGEGITETNERGYETVCECFDQLIGHYAPQFTPDHAPTVEVELVMGLA